MKTRKITVPEKKRGRKGEVSRKVSPRRVGGQENWKIGSRSVGGNTPAGIQVPLAREEVAALFKQEKLTLLQRISKEGEGDDWGRGRGLVALLTRQPWTIDGSPLNIGSEDGIGGGKRLTFDENFEKTCTSGKNLFGIEFPGD